MKFEEAFRHQIENTRILTEDDLKEDTGDIVVWNGVSFFPDGNFYSSGKEMKVGDKLLTAYVVGNTFTPSPMLIEEQELDAYSQTFKVVRVVDHVPVLSYIDDTIDQYSEDPKID